MRQLSLFKGKKQRGIKPPAPLEFQIHCTLADILRRWISPGWKFTHLPLGEIRDRRVNANGKSYSPAGSRLKRMGVTPGWPDFLFIGPDKRTFWLELKRPGSGRLSDDQAEIAAHLIVCGHSYLPTDNINEAVATLKQLGIVRSTIKVQ